MKTQMIKKTACLLAIVLVTIAGCKSAEKQQIVQESTAHIPLAKEKLGDHVVFSFNEDKSYVLAQSEQPEDSNDLSFSFMVFDVKQEKVVMEQDVATGYVKWLSKHEVEVFRTPGKMRNDQTRDDYTMVYNVTTGESMPKTEWKKK